MFRETYLAGRSKEKRLYSQARFQLPVRFRIPWAVFRIPKPENRRFLNQNKFSDSGIRSPLNKGKLNCSCQSGGRGWGMGWGGGGRDLGSKSVWAFSQFKRNLFWPTVFQSPNRLVTVSYRSSSGSHGQESDLPLSPSHDTRSKIWLSPTS